MTWRAWSLLRGPALVLVPAGVLGWLLGQPLALLLAGALGCLGWQLMHLYWLDRWLQRGGIQVAPQSVDRYWRDLYRHFERLYRRNRRRKRKLSRTLHNFQQGVRAIPDAIVVLDRQHKVEWFNPAAHQLLGLDAGKDHGLAITSLVRHPEFIAYLERWPEQETVLFSSPVDPVITLRARLLPYTKKRHLLWLSDVSRALRLEQMRRDFVANASHELRTPLTVITGYLETLQDALGAEQQAWQQPLATMQKQAARMMAIIRDLLLLSRLESADEPPVRVPVDVPGLLERIVADARSLSDGRAHTIELSAEAGLWLSGVERELHSAFANLVFNAVQHTPAGCHIGVRWYQDEHQIHLAVTDDGDGIAVHHLPRLSERFYRIDRSRQRGSGGTGLGLAIVKHVLQRHGGRLNITSQLGVGSCFSCDFPLSAQAPVSPPSRRPAPLDA